MFAEPNTLTITCFQYTHIFIIICLRQTYCFNHNMFTVYIFIVICCRQSNVSNRCLTILCFCFRHIFSHNMFMDLLLTIYHNMFTVTTYIYIHHNMFAINIFFNHNMLTVTISYISNLTIITVKMVIGRGLRKYIKKY